MTTKTFYLEPLQSPTQINLRHYLQEAGWQPALPAIASFSNYHLNFNEIIANNLEYKHLLAQLINQYCPEIMPFTIPIDEKNWPQVLATINNTLPFPCILKPSLLNNGQHIKIFSSRTKLIQHYQSTERLGGPHVIQQYISEPHLLRDDRKYSMRQFVVLTHYNGAYLYKDGYFNVATKPYSHNYQDLAPHLTNEHLTKEAVNVIQIPSTRFATYPDLFVQIKNILSKLVAALYQHYDDLFAQKIPQLALLGIDFMVDKYGQVWLLEVNHGPCFPTNENHPLQNFLYQNFWRELIRYFVLPIAENNLQKLDPNSSFIHVQ